jgi:NhaP-type Na+/H+ or K+/H+ antiporter
MPADELSADKEGGSDGASHLVVLRAIVVLVTLIMSGLMAQILTCHRDVSPPCDVRATFGRKVDP